MASMWALRSAGKNYATYSLPMLSLSASPLASTARFQRGLIAVTVLCYVCIWATSGRFALGGLSILVSDPDAAMAISSQPATTRIAMAAIVAVGLFLLCLALLRLMRLLKCYERGEFFDSGSVSLFRGFCGALLASALYSMLDPWLRQGLLMLLARPGETVTTTFNITSDSVGMLLACGVFYVVARILEEGRRIAEENQAFI